MGKKWFNEGRMGDEKNYVINYLHGLFLGVGD